MEVAKKINSSYSVSLVWSKEWQYGVATAGKRLPLTFAAPPEFGGIDTACSPEHLLATSLSSCYTTTFIHFAKLFKVELRSFHLAVTMHVEKDVVGLLPTTNFLLCPHIIFELNPWQAIIDNLLSKTKRHCIISNSMNGKIIIEP